MKLMTRRVAGFIAMRIIEGRFEGTGQVFVYAPGSADLSQLLRDVMMAYRERSSAMTTPIYDYHRRYASLLVFSS